MDELARHILSDDILIGLAQSIVYMPFETRKDVQTIFSSILRHHSPEQPDASLALPYLTEQHPDLIITLCHGYNKQESAMPSGNILREALKFDSVAAIILYDEPHGVNQGLKNVDASRPTSGHGVFWKFFDWIDRSAFEVGTDAFSTFRVRGEYRCAEQACFC